MTKCTIAVQLTNSESWLYLVTGTKLFLVKLFSNQIRFPNLWQQVYYNITKFYNMWIQILYTHKLPFHCKSMNN